MIELLKLLSFQFFIAFHVCWFVKGGAELLSCYFSYQLSYDMCQRGFICLFFPTSLFIFMGGGYFWFQP
uniref:Uncharacterized protein n=1 Tax=Populus trichocarpa TaxID=3694 RepID=A0A2K2CCE9_POPTR